ncbi:MAG TPA: TonB-dependent receptor [Phenylobacterium sp.]|uniref:TonB-dependent receptor domain-containing protein n=1 Tax=Phenylobacterium sp. TaxID=1871053 RepID=UPI002BE53513|nr:TonB-dependent receptor [Phenylobacterium sp.]HSV01767.1 TonB-dependent receptor [Phenylobacterium sp.]
MQSNTRAMLRPVLLASAAAISLAAPTFAHAQAAPANPPPTGAGGVDVSEIVVTGSRIPRPDLTSDKPVAMVTGQYLRDKGITNIANAVNDLPAMQGSITPAGAQGSFGTGRNFVDLFNLGSQRTLTLVNGRRFVSSQAATLFSGSSPGNQVDLNQLPTAFLDRVEEVPATGAAVYGSDAIAGVVNLIYKDHFEGILLDGQYGESSRHDYPTSHITAAVGHDFLDGKLNLAIDFELDKTGSLVQTQRPETAAQFSFAANPANTSSSDGIPANILIANRRVPELTQGGVGFTRNTFSLGALVTVPDPNNPGQRVPAQFAPDGTLIPYNPGTFFQPSIASGGQGLNLAPLTSLETPVHRKLGQFIARYELTPHIRLHATVFLSDDKSTAPANQPIFQSALFGGLSGNLAISIDNPFLTAQARQNIVASLPAGASSFFLARASTDIVGLSTVKSETKAYDASATAEGDFNALDRDFTWNVTASHGQTKAFFISPGINQANFALAVDAVKDQTTGQIVCRSTLTNPGNGCQPLNLFGQGAPSAAALKFIDAEFRSDDKDTQDDLEANLTGTIWKLPAGNWGFNLGYEHRREEASFTPNENARLGVGRSVPIPPAAGSYNTNEYYVESLLPVLGGEFSPIWAGQKLEFEGAYRKVDNSLAGKNEAWSFGGRYSPIEDITFRASRSKTFRAPAITELFLPASTAFSLATDPCDVANINAGPNPKTRAANCAADFAKLGATLNGFKSTIQVASQPITTSGNPNLKNEEGKSWTYGVVFQPRFVPGLALAWDYVHIDLTNAIVNFNATSILSTCFDSPSHPADVCSRFVRDATGQITTVNAGFVNAGFTNFAGDTYELSYSHDIDDLPGVHTGRDLGNLGVDWNVFHTRRLKTSVSGTGFDLSDTEGTIGSARWKYLLNVRYTYENLRVTWTTHFIQHSLFDRTFTIENRNILSVGDYYTHDLTAQYKFPHDITLRAGVDNILDKQPPFPTVGIGTYDQVGRYFFVGATWRH